MPKEIAVFMMRGEPVHNSHLETIKIASKESDRVIVIFGSAGHARSIKNPFTYDERKSLLIKILKNEGIDNVVIDGTRDTIYADDKWVLRITSIVKSYTAEDDVVSIFGHNKDASSYYLKMFPSWKFVEVGALSDINATDIRNMFFSPSTNLTYIKHCVPSATLAFLEEFRKTDTYSDLVEEFRAVEKIKEEHARHKYKPISVTADAIVICKGHVLLVERKGPIGKGQLAFPGGYLNYDEGVEKCAIRELKEETNIDIPDSVLIAGIFNRTLFDHPSRSVRGRIITHAYAIKLTCGSLPAVKASDDAVAAKWVAFDKVDLSTMFEDHYEIFEDVLCKMKKEQE